MTADLIDTHCHLTSKELYPHSARVIADAQNAGVTQMITVACRAAEAEQTLVLRDQHPCVWIAAGIHPHEAGRITEDELNRLSEIWKQPGVVAAGEMGLDYHYDFSPADVQRNVFAGQLQLARPTQLPIVIHCREAHHDVIRILADEGYANKPVVFHCFSGTPEEAAELRAHGWRTSFTGLITFKNADAQRQALTETPQDQLMFETDSPYLSPEPVRKMRPNEPQNIVHTVRYAAAHLQISVDDLARITTTNARNFFRLDCRA